MTQYTVGELWCLDIAEFLRLTQRAERIQRQRENAMKRSNKKRSRGRH